jgi:hypothetical protein
MIALMGYSGFVDQKILSLLSLDDCIFWAADPLRVVKDFVSLI